MDCVKEKEKIISFLRAELEKEKKDGFVFGLSGGIDSTVVAYLLKEAVGKNKVLALIMPDLDSEPSNKKDALLIAKTLGIKYRVIPITEALRSIGVYKEVPLWIFLLRPLKIKVVTAIYEKYARILGKPLFFAIKDGVNPDLYWFNRGKAYYGIKHRIRMAVLYFFAEKENYLVVGCTNLTERLIGFYVRYGDDVADITPISHLYKTEVIELAKYIGVPKKIIEKAPSPDLIPGLVDERTIGISYREIDSILKSFEEGRCLEEIEDKVDKKMVKLLYEQYVWIKEQNKKPWRLAR
ncbi:MAG: NAD(+) synthase [bacterium]